MARESSSSSSPKVATVSQVCETGCGSRLYRILNFRDGHAPKRLVSNTRHSNNTTTHAIENGNSGRRTKTNLLTTVDEKYSHIHTRVSSKRKNYLGCKSISCVKNDPAVATVHQGNEATNKVLSRNWVNRKYLCKDGAISEPHHQFLDALQILYSNKELFQKLVQDQNSLSVKEQYQAGQKMLTNSAFESKWINSQSNHATQCGTPYSGCRCPLHSPGTFSHNVSSLKHSYFPLSHTKIKLRHAMAVRKKEAKGLESVRRKSSSSVHSGLAKGRKLSLDFKERQKMKIRDFMSCRGQNDVSVHESCGRNITRASFSPTLQNIQNTHVEATKNDLSEILNCRIEEQNNNEPPGDVVKTVKDDLHFFVKNVEKNPPGNGSACNGIPTGSEELMESGCDLHAKGIRHSRDGDSPSQSFDVDITSDVNGSVLAVEDDAMDITNMIDDHHYLNNESAAEKAIEEVTNAPTIVSQSAELPIQAVNDNSEGIHSSDPIRCSLDLVNSSITSTGMSESDCDREILQALSLKWDELVMKFELPDQLIMYPSTLEELKGLTNQLCGSTVLFDYVMEVFMETYQYLCRSPHHISIGRPNVQAYVLKRIMVRQVEEFIGLHYHQHYQPPRTLEQFLKQDLARQASWLNVQVDVGDIATEVQEDVLQELILEIISETDNRQV